MPHYNSAQSFHGYVSLAQVCSPPATMLEHDLARQEYFDFDPTSPMSPELPDGSFTFSYGRMACSAEQQSCQSLPWDVKRSATTPIITEYTSSSQSNSPSPAETVEEHQHHKRRAQNRAAQRAYRDRKVRHLLDIERGIRDIEKKMMYLQNENTELIRQLCETRAANNDLKRSNALPKLSGSSEKQNDGQVLSRSRINGDRPMSSANNMELEEAETLYEPFAAMWNLISMDPSVVHGKVSARTILENLRGLAETEAAKLDNRLSQSSADADDRYTPGSSKAQA